jgi:serine/threonine protein kinase
LRDEKTRFDFSEVVRWAERILDGFSYLHLNLPPIIYSDLKPQNIFLTSDGEIKLLASAILRNRIADAGTGNLSETALQYSPLEQIWNSLDPASQKVIVSSYDETSERILRQKIDARSDIYSLGVLMYQLLIGQIPKNALERSIGILENGTDPLVSPETFNPNLPLEITEILVRSLAVKRENRMDSAVIMRQILRTAFVRIKEREAAEPEVLAYASPTAVVNTEKFESLTLDDDKEFQKTETFELPLEAEQSKDQNIQTSSEYLQRKETPLGSPKNSEVSKEFGDWDEEDVLWLENSVSDSKENKTIEENKTIIESDQEKAADEKRDAEILKEEIEKKIEQPKVEPNSGIALPKAENSEIISVKDAVKIVPETAETDYKKDYTPDQFSTLFDSAETKSRSKFGVPVVALVLFLIGGGAVGAWYFTARSEAGNTVQTQTEPPVNSMNNPQPQTSTEPEIQPAPTVEAEKTEVPSDVNSVETTPETAVSTENNSENPVLSQPTAPTAKKQTAVKQTKPIPAKPQTADAKPSEKQPKKLTVDDLINDN